MDWASVAVGGAVVDPAGVDAGAHAQVGVAVVRAVGVLERRRQYRVVVVPGIVVGVVGGVEVADLPTQLAAAVLGDQRALEKQVGAGEDGFTKYLEGIAVAGAGMWLSPQPGGCGLDVLTG